jgi:hypothetical protein
MGPRGVTISNAVPLQNTGPWSASVGLIAQSAPVPYTVHAFCPTLRLDYNFFLFLVDFVIPKKGESLLAAYDKWRNWADEKGIYDKIVLFCK